MASTSSTTEVKMNDITRTCRVCMATCSAMKWIFEAGSTIVEQIEYCTGIHVIEDTRLPTSICLNCYAKLVVAYKFKTTITASNESFLKILKNIKLEIKYEPKEEVKVEFDNVVNISDDDFVADDDYEKVPVQDVRELLKKVNKPVKSVKGPVRSVKELIKNVKESVRIVKRPVHNVKGQEDGTVLINKDVAVFTRIRNRRKKEKPPRKCSHCHQDFKNILELREHIKSTHKIGPWICESCGKQLFRYASYYSHVRSHLPAQYFCDKCDYKAKTKQDMTKHIRIHTGEKPYQCELCTQSFRYSSNLHGHRNRVHFGLKRFRCDRCDMPFDSKSKLSRHLDTHDNIKRHECEFCSSCYARRELLRKHLQKEHSVIMPLARRGPPKNNIVLEKESNDVKNSPVNTNTLDAKLEAPVV